MFLEGFPVKTSARRVGITDLPAEVQAFGSKCSESLERCGLRLSGRKTVRTCVPVDSAPSSRDLPAWGMTADGECWELATLARPTKESECGFLPTPATEGNEYLPSKYGTRGQRGAKMQKRVQRLQRKMDGGPWLAFREWMMGWPIGWTALEPLETAKFQRWLRLHGRC